MSCVVCLAFAGCGNADGGAEAAKAATPTPAPVAEAKKPAAPAAPSGPVVSDPSFELRADVAKPVGKGELGSFSVTLTPKGGYHVNQDFPTHIDIEAPDAVAVPKTAFEKADAVEFDDNKARFDVPYTPEAEGDHKVVAKVAFAVCTPATCVPDERTLTFVVPVATKVQ